MNVWLTPNEAAARLDTSLTTLRRMRSTGIISPTQFGRKVRYAMADVDRLINEGWTCQDQGEMKTTDLNKPGTATGTSISAIPLDVLAGGAVQRAHETAQRLKRNSRDKS